ncbi:RTA1 like protein-domain-containing protein [Podospora didyma]|uniref:RTA1 like protein-domain-containing protein n=1 Tax=Podospora didyma TaxID=330526 RepID=A0AAE0NGA6_9PEZI|nr:RTA1 like protein-domain-containing protein [Podospora didyma]
MSDEPKIKHRYYYFDPSVAANSVFVVLFGITAIGHTIQLIRKKTWYFIPFTIACYFEAIGYVGRALNASQTPDWTFGPFLMQALLILLGPALYAASVYMVLGRLIRLLDAHHLSIVRTNWLTKIFVAGDVVSFLVQGAGGGILSNAKTKKDQDLGNAVLLVGLAVQVVFFGLFIITTVLFHIRIIKKPTQRSFSITAPWRQFILALYASSVLILIRSIFRMIEYGAGSDSVLQQSEAYLLALDGALMFLVAVIFLWYHPHKILVGYKDASGTDNEGGYHSRDGSRGEILPMGAPTRTLSARDARAAKRANEGTTAPQYGYAN